VSNPEFEEVMARIEESNRRTEELVRILERDMPGYGKLAAEWIDLAIQESLERQ
jgi:hypothetical protein